MVSLPFKVMTGDCAKAVLTVPKMDMDRMKENIHFPVLYGFLEAILVFTVFVSEAFMTLCL
jgi:hypothetical protein